MIAQQVVILISSYRVQFLARRALACLFCLLFSVGLMHGAKTRTLSQVVQKGTDVRWLEEGKPIERQLSGGESHSYQLTVTTGQYARVIVEQKGIDVVVIVFGPDGKLITAVDNPNGSQGAETVHITAEATGIYRLEVTSFEKEALPGLYQANLAEVRPATEADKKRLTARRAFDEGQRLQDQNTPESLPVSRKNFEDALALYRQIEDPIEQITVLLGTANTNRLMNDLQKALECYKEALRIAQALGDKYRQARALEFTADVYSSLGETENALRTSDEALQLYQATGAKTTEAMMLSNIGNIYSSIGEAVQSREYFSRSLRLYRTLDAKYNEAVQLQSIGYSYRLEDDSQNALEYFNQALSIFRTLKIHEEEAQTLALISNQFADSNERQKALANAEEALNLLRCPDVRKVRAAAVLTRIGRTYYTLGDSEKALTFYDEPLRMWQGLGAKQAEANTLYRIATAQLDLGRLEEAKVNIEKSIAIAEYIRDHAGNAEQRAAFVANFFDVYEVYIDVFMRLHAANPQAANDLAALAFTEKVKQRSLVELLGQARVELQEGVDVGLVAREKSINERITVKLDELAKLLKGQYKDQQRSAVERGLDALRSEQRQVQAEISARNSHYASLTAPQPLSIREIQQQVLDDNTILLDFELGEKRSYLWTITPDGVLSYQLPSKAQIETQARRVYELLTARQPAPNLTLGQQRAREKAADLQYQKEASVLSNMLLEPVARQLGTKRLAIVADGALQYLPFAVLPAPAMSTMETKSDLRPLIMDHEIVSLPSASVLAVLRRELAYRKPAAKVLAVLADPVFEVEDARVKSRLTSSTTTGVASSASTATLKRALRSVRGDDGNIKLQRLLFSRDEAEAILSFTSNQSNLEALDFRANRKLAMSDELSQYRIVHFSTHGLLDSRHPELSGLVLSLVDEAGRPQDGYLRLQDIFTLRLNADLVVLSACQTGLGKDVRGEGLIGLVRGFMYAGAPRVMSSMWEVDDAATAELMKRFYRGVLQEKLTPAGALRAAQIEMLRKSHWQSPYYWGAFVLQGEWR